MPPRVRLVLAATLGMWIAAAPAATHDATFDAWLAELRAEALELGIREATLDKALTGLQPIARVVELDRRQPEVTQTFAQYMARRISPALVEQGRRAYRRHRAVLEAVGAKYGVQPRFIVALWGLESRYGRHTGGFSVIAALATLAFDARRSAFFRREVLNALRIVDQGHITPERMTGSWAGAMGHNQFMPSSSRRFAVDHDGDGRRDIWGTPADIFASTANYLARSGWRGGQTWGREISLPEGFDPKLVGRDVVKPVGAWRRLGVRSADGHLLAAQDLKASIVMPGGTDGPAYIVYDNYRTILRWNRSDYFAVSVGHLADLLAAG